jgi:outer membrane receptor for ferrienterochelin and colicin
MVPANLANENQRTDFMANANASFGGLDLRFLYDRLRSDSYHADAVLPTSGVAERATYEQKSFKAAYTIKASPKLKITPKYLYRFTQPYYMHAPEIPDSFTYFTRRHEIGAVADIAFTDSSALMAGYTYSHLRIEAEPPDNLSNFPGGHTDESNSVFAESTTSFSLGNLVVGARYEIPNNYDPAFVPRIGLTKAYDRWHYKLMAAQSYRMPQGIQADLTGAPERGLKPETATNYEAEAGYMISDQVFLVGNLFDTHIKNPLVWTPESGNPEGIYSNQGEIGTQGAEAELRYVPSSKFEVNTNLSFYRRAHANDSIYVVPDHDDQYLAFSKVRGNLVMGYKPTANFGIFPSVSYFGTRYGYIPSDGGAGSADVVKEYDPMFVTNLNMRWTDLGLRGVEFTAGIMNLFDAKIDYSQSYNKGYNYPPVPGHSRAYNFMLAYSREY